MNKRARNRLIAVTVIILGIAAAVFASSGPVVYAKSVNQAIVDRTLIGKRIKIKGTVVAGSWDKRTNPMTFKIRTTGKTSGPQLAVVYGGGAPSTFGDGVDAIVTGTLEKGPLLTADDMSVVCPSVYASKSAAITVEQLLKSKAAPHTQVYGAVKSLRLSAPGADRFVLESSTPGGGELHVRWDGAIPAGTKDGAWLVVGGSYDGAGVMVATTVALASTSK